MSRSEGPKAPTEAEIAASDDAVAGLAMVKERVGRCTTEEQAAFWEAVCRCFGGGKPPDMTGNATERAAR